MIATPSRWKGDPDPAVAAGMHAERAGMIGVAGCGGGDTYELIMMGARAQHADELATANKQTIHHPSFQ
jgi:hypothetical protein